MDIEAIRNELMSSLATIVGTERDLWTLKYGAKLLDEIDRLTADVDRLQSKVKTLEDYIDEAYSDGCWGC